MTRVILVKDNGAQEEYHPLYFFRKKGRCQGYIATQLYHSIARSVSLGDPPPRRLKVIIEADEG